MSGGEEGERKGKGENGGIVYPKHGTFPVRDSQVCSFSFTFYFSNNKISAQTNETTKQIKTKTKNKKTSYFEKPSFESDFKTYIYIIYTVVYVVCIYTHNICSVYIYTQYVVYRERWGRIWLEGEGGGERERERGGERERTIWFNARFKS